MIACGQFYQPTKVEFEVQTFPSSTRPALVQTDVGLGYIKGLNNPAGIGALVSELIASELGTWFGLQLPHFAILMNYDIEVNMKNNGQRIEPPCYYSHNIHSANAFDETDLMLSKLIKNDDLSKLIVFDTWIRNFDRYLDGESNPDNIIFSYDAEAKGYHMHPIDHSHCISDVDFIGFPLDEEAAEDERIFGLFPAFAPFISGPAIDAAVSQLGTLERGFVDACLNQIPTQWGVTGATKRSLADFICNRAGYVVSNIRGRLVTAPELPGVG
ncbi:MAG: hypothetical protein IOC63_10880 [Methylobacterium sp.]|nr:hypothetical protein [Methylobacterium sp.]